MSDQQSPCTVRRRRGTVEAADSKIGRIATTLAIGGLLLGATGTAHAQCAFDAPAKAKSIKSRLVRAYASCPGVTFPTPNTSTMAGVPACAAPAAHSAYEFDDETGECSFRASHKVQTPCPDGVAASCSVVRIVTKCRGIMDPGGATPTNTANWALNMVHRATLDDDPNGDMTLVDVPGQLTMPAAVNGKLKLIFVVGDCTGGCLFGFGPSYALPPCTQLELISVALLDPDGNVFAKLGSSGR